MLLSNSDQESYKPFDEIDVQSCRPDFAVLIYPAYLTEPRDSNDLDPGITKLDRNATPSMFITVARDDPFARGMLNFFLAVRQAKVSAECHVYAAGGHGGGIDPVSYPSSQWTAACEGCSSSIRRNYAAWA